MISPRLRPYLITVIVSFVMPARFAGIHVFLRAKTDVDGREEPGHDG
jgi:hypothetical protein